MNKRITIKKIMLMLYALLMCLPLISVGFRSLYVTFNENAFESYTSNYNIATTEYITDTDNLVENNTYYLNYINNETSFSTNSGKLYFSNSNVTTLLQPYTNIDLSLVKCFSVGYYEGSTYNDTIILYDNDGVRVFSLQYNTNAFQEIFVTNNNTIWFVYLNKTTSHHTIVSSWKCYLYVYGRNINTLDNAFDYSLHEFIDNNNTGLINFVGLFSDMFLGNSNVENGLYLGFANFMMNYALFISCAYFVFEVLMWFINYCRKWLYAFEEKGGAE